MNIAAKDRKQVLWVARAAEKIAADIEGVIGNPDQHNLIPTFLMAFWVVLEDEQHPRNDASTWKELVHDVMQQAGRADP